MKEEAKFSDYPLEVQIALIHQDSKRYNTDIKDLTTKVNNLEKSDAVMKEQISSVSSDVGEIKDTQKAILDKLDKKQEDDLKQSRETKMLLVGTILTSIASLVVALLLK